MRRPRIRYLVLAALAVAVLGFFGIRWGLEAYSDATAADPVQTLAGITPPGPGWSHHELPSSDVLQSESRGDEPFQDEHGIWQDDGGGRYLVSFSVALGPATRDARCREAAAWVVRVGQSLPGERIAGVGDRRSEAALARECLRLASQRLDPDTAATDAFGGWPNTRSGDVQYGPWLELTTAGGRDVTLSANVAAIAQE